MENLILIGMPGSGKSTVGVLLAKRLGYDFLDTDLILQQREGMLLQPLLETRGVEEFLDAEEAAIRSVFCRRTVLAPGGSCVRRAGGMEHLKSMGTILYLSVPLDELTRRLHNMASRGIAMAPGESLETVFAARAPLYARWAGLTLSVPSGQGLERTATAAYDLLRAEGGRS